jgi:hypothetical protein
MMNETEEMRQARHALQELSASDPAASSNMLRYVAAFSIMVTGRRGRDRRGAEPQIGAGFVLTRGDQNLCAAATRRSGTDYLYIAFDVDDAAGPPVAAGVFSRRGDDMVAFGNCRLWSPANDGRALLVPQGCDGYGGFIAFRPGLPFRFVEAPLPGDFEAGVRRAETRLRRLLASDDLRDLGGGYMHVIRNEGDHIYAQSSRIAA